MILCFNILSFIVYILILASNSFVRSSFFLLSIYIHPFPTPKTPNIPLKPLSPSPTLLNMLKTECALCRWITRESYSWGNNRRVPIYQFSRHCWYQPWRRIDRTVFVPSSCWKKCDPWALLLPSLLATCAPARCCGPCRASGRCPQQISCSNNPSISTNYNPIFNPNKHLSLQFSSFRVNSYIYYRLWGSYRYLNAILKNSNFWMSTSVWWIINIIVIMGKP